MADQRPPGRARLAAGRERALAVYRSRRLRKTLLILAVVLLVFGAFGFLAAPSILKSQIEKRASAALQRPVTLGKVHLNPYTLKLDLEQLHVGERDGRSPFVDIDRLTVNTSWASVFRLAPVLDGLTLQHPQIHITRSSEQRFNFSDLIDRFASAPPAPDASPTRFALSNISVHDGDIQFDDQVTKTRHRVDQLELGIPFIANLPHDVDVFVQPLLAMRVDGSPMRIEGQTKPFASTLESSVSFRLDHLDLPRYLGYVPVKLPVAIPRGLLSGMFDLHFVQARPTPQLQLTGNLQLDDFALDNSRGEAIARLGNGTAQLLDVQPLASRYRLGTLKLDNAQIYYTQATAGHNNFDTLTGNTPAPRADDRKAAPTDLRIATIALTDSALHYTDADRHKLDLARLHGNLQGLSMLAAPAAKIDLAAELYGGNISATGTLDLAAARLAMTLGLK